jgi:hypothetical protein
MQSALVSDAPESSAHAREAQGAYRELEAWIFTPETLSRPLHEVEKEQAQRAREMNRLLYEAHLRARGVGDVGPAIVVTEAAAAEQEVNHTHRRQQPCRLTTQFGDVRIERMAYHAPGHESLRPLDHIVSLPAHTLSYEMQRSLVRLCVHNSFDEAKDTLCDFTGVGISKDTAETIAREAAVDFEPFYQQRALPPPENTSAILVGSVDGKGIPMVKEEKAAPVVRLKRGEKPNKKRMATVATVYTVSPRMRTPEDVVASLFEPERKALQKEDGNQDTPSPPHQKPEHKRVWASLRLTKVQIIEALQKEMHDRDPENKKQHVVLTDGERALQKGVIEHLPNAELILDLLHVLERLWTMGHAFHGEGTPEAQEWVRKHLLELLHGKVSQVVKGARQSATKRKIKGQKLDVIETACNYLYANRERMQYDKYLAHGFPIASGAIEGACKHLVKDRMERSGMRWKEPTAEAILQLRALVLSGHFEEYWKFHIQQEQDRLYGSRAWIPLTEDSL